MIDDIFGNEKINSVEVRKKFTSLVRRVQNESKPDKCILCGRSCTSFCNSHSVPKMVLKNIADNGMVLQSNKLVGLSIVDTEKGVNNSGTFHFICNDCDSKYFQRYENPESYENIPNRYVLAEIAMKNTLLQLSKRQFEKKLYEIIQNESDMFRNPDYLMNIQDLDSRDYLSELQYHKDVAEGKSKEKYDLIFYKKLPYKVPIAAQTGLTLHYDFDGYLVNDIYNMSEDYYVETLHLCVFPMETESIVILFTRKCDKKYDRFIKQFGRIPLKKKIEYINWLIFKYTENYFLSNKIQAELETNQIIKALSKDVDGYPNFGYSKGSPIKQKPIEPSDIPNFLDQKWKI